MWYVFYCPNVDSEEVIRSCRKYFSQKALKEAFIFTYDRMRKYEGAWHMEKQEVFPNYIFLESEDEKCLEKEWKQCEQSKQCEDGSLIFADNKKLIPVPSKEEELLKSMCDDKHHLKMSRGYIRNGRTYVTEGPLYRKEEWIKKIDRHKRLAKLELPCESGKNSENNKNNENNENSESRWKEIRIGLEIVKKE